MITSVEKILKLIDAIAPFSKAALWDNSGLLVGKETKEVHRILLALDVTEEVIEEAIEEGIDLIVSHHPIIFDALKQITFSTRIGKMLIKLIQNDIAVICAHTNVDRSINNGINQWIARQYGIPYYLPLVKSGDLEGFGVIGDLHTPMSIDCFFSETKKIFNTQIIKISNVNRNKTVRKIAISSGASSEFIPYAVLEKADLYITSDLKYHECQSVIGTQTGLIDIGHFESEFVYLNGLLELLESKIREKNYDVVVKVTETEKPIIQYV